MGAHMLVFLAMLAANALSVVVPAPSSFDFVRALVEEDMQILNPNKKMNVTDAHIGGLLKSYTALVLDEEVWDFDSTKKVEIQLRTNALTLGASAMDLQQSVLNFTTKIDVLRNESKPSEALTEAINKRNVIRASVHRIHRQCKKTTADADRQIKELNHRIEEVDFIRSSLKSAADPDVVGRLVRRYGSVADLDASVERSLMHLMALQSQVVESSHNVHQAVDLLQLGEEVGGATWSESVYDILSSLKTSLAPSVSYGLSQASIASSMVTDYLMKKFYSMTAPVPVAASVTEPSHPTISSTSDLAEQMLLLMKDRPTDTQSVQSVPSSASYILEPISLHDFQVLCEKSVVMQFNHTVAPAISESELILAMSEYFHKSVDGASVADAFLKSIFEEVIGLEKSTFLYLAIDALPKSLPGVVLTVTSRNPETLASVSAAVQSGVFLSRFVGRLYIAEPIPQFTLRAADAPTASSPVALLSLEEGSDGDDACSNGDLACEGRAVGVILDRIAKSASKTLEQVMTAKETLMQPCAARLVDAQTDLASADKHVKELELVQTNYTASIEVLVNARDVLSTARLRAYHSALSREDRVRALREHAETRLNLREHELAVVDALTAYLGAEMAKELLEKREELAEQRKNEGETESFLLLLQSQLDQRRMSCDAVLADYDTTVSRFRNSVAVLERIATVLNEIHSFDSAARTTVSVMALAIDSRLDTSDLLQKSGSEDALDKVKLKVGELIGAAMKVIDDTLAERNTFQANCDSDILRLREEIKNALSGNTPHTA